MQVAEQDYESGALLLRHKDEMLCTAVSEVQSLKLSELPAK